MDTTSPDICKIKSEETNYSIQQKLFASMLESIISMLEHTKNLQEDGLSHGDNVAVYTYLLSSKDKEIKRKLKDLRLE